MDVTGVYKFVHFPHKVPSCSGSLGPKGSAPQSSKVQPWKFQKTFVLAKGGIAKMMLKQHGDPANT